MNRTALGRALAMAFHVAATTNDVEIVELAFSLPDVRNDLVVWNAVNRAERLGEPLLIRVDDPAYVRTRFAETLFAAALGKRERVEIVRWLFAREQLGILEETLRAILLEVGQASVSIGDATSLEKIEILLESAFVQEVLNAHEPWGLLGVVLHSAASRGHANVLDTLLAYGADPNFEAIVGFNACANDLALDTLEKHGAWLIGTRVFMPFTIDQDYNVVGDLLRRGADANAVVQHYGSALHYAASWCLDEPAARLLIQEGYADVDVRDPFGRTPLMVIGFDLLRTVLRGAQAQEHRALVKLLLDAGAEINAVDYKHQGILHRAVGIWDLECLRMVLARGAEPDAQDVDGQTPIVAFLRGAIVDSENTKRQLRLLLHAGADPFVADNGGINAVHLLETSEAGRALIQEHQTFFRRWQAKCDM